MAQAQTSILGQCRVPDGRYQRHHNVPAGWCGESLAAGRALDGQLGGKAGMAVLRHSGLTGMYCREKTPSLVIQKGTERWCPEVSDWDTDPSDPSGMGCSGISNRAETGDFCTIHHAKLAEEGVK